MNEYVPTGLFWLSLALINAGLAEQKSRSRLNWFLVSVLLGPIATFCIVAWDPPEQKHVTFAESTGKYRAAKRLQRARAQEQKQQQAQAQEQSQAQQQENA